MDINKAAHDISMLYISKKFESTVPSVEALTREYIKAYQTVSSKLDAHIDDSVAAAPQWNE